MTRDMYRLRDMDHRDDDGAPFEFTVPTLTEMVPYVDGPLRGDVTSSEGVETVDEAIDAMRRENFPLAQQRLRELSVYIDMDVEASGA